MRRVEVVVKANEKGGGGREVNDRRVEVVWWRHEGWKGKGREVVWVMCCRM